MQAMQPARGRARVIEPFWQRLPAISLYPLKGAALAALIVLSLARLVTLLPGILGMVLNLLVTVATYRFAAEVLWHTANGKLSAPEGLVTDSDIGWTQVKVQFSLWIIIFSAFVLLGPVVGTFVAIFVAVGAPGAMISAAIDQDFWHAINPATWLGLMARLGWPYFVVAGLCLVFLVSQLNAQALIVPKLPPVVGTIAFYGISTYATIAAFHLMGYLVYQYHDVLGYEIDAPPVLDRRAATGADADQALLDEAEALVREDRARDSEDLLREQVASRAVSPAVHLRYRKLLALRGDVDALRRHANDYVAALMATNDVRRAVDLVREMQERDPAYKPPQAEHVTAIAERAAATGQAQVALRLLQGFHKAYPKSPDVPKNYFLAAKLLAEKMNREDQAKALLSQVRQQYPGHPLLPEIETYQRFLENLKPITRGGAQ